MKKRIVIIGSGFVGAFVAKLLRFEDFENTDIILLSNLNHFLFAPLLIERLAGAISAETCSRALTPWARKRRVHAIQATVLSVDRTQRALSYIDTLTHQKEILHYETLIFAQGGTTNFFGTPGAKKHALPLKSLDDVTCIHHRIDTLLIQASQATTTEEKRALLTMVVAGGGPAGIEAICSLRHYSRDSAQKNAPELLPLLSFFIIEAAPDILPGFPEALRVAVKKELDRQKITLYTNEPVTGVSQDSVTTDKQRIASSLLLWTAGITPNIIPIAPPFEVQSPTGIPALKETLQIDTHHFSAGDVVSVEWASKRLPKNGQLAMQLARHLANQVTTIYKEIPTPSFTPKQQGLFLGMTETGYLSIGSFVLRHRCINTLRQYLYRFRMWQIL